ncbi:uncharacterized protein TRIADDRAFT_58677 [Trichoplax adhaerens]|uniref:Uncharacterized protein n=1 Tax=Trichoplax adhaerens TaxID=10228 RepID=B3S3D3_TRIAD|nr:predicted protein [Trichoplax adhaerens]EDV22949.1 predicted protein [Trichoplax adhaerens]|eukprot:XP_002114815.1 predicted protein [Trichoplax adhaerens]
MDLELDSFEDTAWLGNIENPDTEAQEYHYSLSQLVKDKENKEMKDKEIAAERKKIEQSEYENKTQETTITREEAIEDAFQNKKDGKNMCDALISVVESTDTTSIPEINPGVSLFTGTYTVPDTQAATLPETVSDETSQFLHKLSVDIPQGISAILQHVIRRRCLSDMLYTDLLPTCVRLALNDRAELDKIMSLLDLETDIQEMYHRHRCRSKANLPIQRDTSVKPNGNCLKECPNEYNVLEKKVLLVILCSTALDNNYRSLEKDIAVCCHNIMNSFEDSVWKLQAVNIASCISSIAAHMYDCYYLTTIDTCCERGRSIVSYISCTMMRKLMKENGNNYNFHYDVFSEVQVSELLNIVNSWQKPDEKSDYYILYMFILFFRNMIVLQLSPFENSSRKAIASIADKLRWLFDSIKESGQDLKRSQVKNLILNVIFNLEAELQADSRSNQRSIVEYLDYSTEDILTRH